MIEQKTHKNELVQHVAVDKLPTKSRRYRTKATITMPPEIAVILEKYSKDVKANTSQVCFIALCNFLMMSSQISKEDKLKINEILLTDSTSKRRRYNPNPVGAVITLDIESLLTTLEGLRELFLLRDFEPNND